MKNELRTIVLSTDPAFPPRSGADLRNAAHVAAASRLGPVLAVSLYGGIESESPVPVGALGSRRRSAYSVGSSRAVVSLNRSELARFDALLGDFQADVVVVEGVALAPLFPAIRQSAARLVLDMHNVESELARMIATAEPWTKPFRRCKTLVKARALAAVERKAVQLADAVWVCSEADRKRLARVTGFAEARIVPNGIPFPMVADHSGTAGAGPRIIFVGHLGYRPNVRAARELAEEIMPLLRGQCPNATLTLAGRSPSRHVLRLAGPFVRIVANPPVVSALLARSDFAIVPLRQGGGTRIKILEAMASGVLVVATSVAVEGLHVVAGKHFALAETAPDMAQAVSRMTGDPVASAAMTACAREFVASRYSGKVIAERVIAEIQCVSRLPAQR
jgi:glycosyltransferase involved in cell wall biosynthesis